MSKLEDCQQRSDNAILASLEAAAARLRKRWKETRTAADGDTLQRLEEIIREMKGQA